MIWFLNEVALVSWRNGGEPFRAGERVCEEEKRVRWPGSAPSRLGKVGPGGLGTWLRTGLWQLCHQPHKNYSPGCLSSQQM